MKLLKPISRCLISVLFLCISVIAINKSYRYESLTITIEKSNFSDTFNPLLSELCSRLKNPENCLLSEPDDLWRIFWDTGKGYNEGETFGYYVKSYEDVVRFEIPGRIRKFRLDPGHRPQLIIIKSICIENSRQKFCWQPEQIAKDFIPLQDIRGFSAKGKELCLHIAGTGPIIGFNGHIPDIIRSDKGFKVYSFYGIAVMLSVGIYLLIPLILRFFQRHPEYWKKLFLSEKSECQPQSATRIIAIWLLVFFYFSIWAVLKPPGQVPDEIAHLFKMFSITQYKWFTPEGHFKIERKSLNPILDYPESYLVPGHLDKKFTPRDYIAMKSFKWHNDSELKDITTSAHSYPTLYYTVVFLFSELFKKIFHLSPFDTLYTYRFVSAFFSSLLWLWVYHSLRIFLRIASYRNFLFWGVVLIPMSGFMASGVNPDAFLNPLTALFMIYSYSALLHGQKMLLTIVIFLLALFVKPAALVIFPAFAILTCGILMLENNRRQIIKRFLILTIPAFIISYFGFYRWSLPVLYGIPVNLGLGAYILQFVYKIPGFFIMYWGDLGWLDVRLGDSEYWRLRDILILNVLCVMIGWRDLKDKPWVWYLFCFAVIYCFGVVAGEYHYLSNAGYTLQGRYLLPASLGLSMFLIHRFLPAKYIFMAYLLFLNISLMNQSLYRYFNFDWSSFWANRSIYRHLWDMRVFLPF